MPSLVTYTSPALSSATPPGDRRKSIPLNGSTVWPDVDCLDAADGLVVRYPAVAIAAMTNSTAAPLSTHRLRLRSPVRAKSGAGDSDCGPDGGRDPGGGGGPVRRHPPPSSSQCSGRALVSPVSTRASWPCRRIV